MLPVPEKMRSLFLPTKIAANFRPDIGIVLACGPDVTLWRGEMVVVDGYQGQWLEDFEVNSYKTDNQIRVYGKCTEYAHGECIRVPWDECVLCQILPEELEMLAIHTNLIVRRDALVTHQNGMELPDWSKYHTGLGTVVSIGPKCQLTMDSGEIQVGDRIHFDLRAVHDFIFDGDSDLVLIPELAVNFKISEPVEQEVAA